MAELPLFPGMPQEPRERKPRTERKPEPALRWFTGRVLPEMRRGYTHLVRAPDDPERSPRLTAAQRKGRTPTEIVTERRRRIRLAPLEEHEQTIKEILGDRALTFNAISVLGWDDTADHMFQTRVDEALWNLVERGELEHTAVAPILFRAVTAGRRVGQPLPLFPEPAPTEPARAKRGKMIKVIKKIKPSRLPWPDDPAVLPEAKIRSGMLFQGERLKQLETGQWILYPAEAGRLYQELDKHGRPRWKWESEAKTKTGKPKRELVVHTLQPDQLHSIRFAMWLSGSPVERFMQCVKAGCLVAVSISGGKDSQAMFLYLTRELRVPRDQIFAVHADLPGVDWPEATPMSHTITAGYPLEVVRAKTTFIEMVERRKRFPTPKIRQCTSDLKTGPILKAIRHELCRRIDEAVPCKVTGTPWQIVVDCEGSRAAESLERAKEPAWRLDVEQCKGGRAWFKYQPIQHWAHKSSDQPGFTGKRVDVRTRYPEELARDVLERNGWSWDKPVPEVFAYIIKHGQEPWWRYGKLPKHQAMLRREGLDRGMPRMSCRFCIMASAAELATAAIMSPGMVEAFRCLEQRTGHLFKHKESIVELARKGREKARRSLPVIGLLLLLLLAGG